MSHPSKVKTKKTPFHTTDDTFAWDRIDSQEAVGRMISDGFLEMSLTVVIYNSTQVISITQPTSPASAASVTGTPSRAKSRNEMWMPNSRAC